MNGSAIPTTKAKGKEIPKEVYNAYYARVLAHDFMSGMSDHQIAKSNHSAVGEKDDLGFVKNIYEAKKENQQKASGSTDAETKKLLWKGYCEVTLKSIRE